MAVTDTILIGLGGLSLLITAPQFLALERELKVLLAWLAVVLWGIIGLSGFAVASEAWAGTQSVMVVVILGFGMAALVAIQALDQTAKLIGERSGATTADGLLGEA